MADFVSSPPHLGPLQVGHQDSATVSRGQLEAQQPALPGDRNMYHEHLQHIIIHELLESGQRLLTEIHLALLVARQTLFEKNSSNQRAAGRGVWLKGLRSYRRATTIESNERFRVPPQRSYTTTFHFKKRGGLDFSSSSLPQTHPSPDFPEVRRLRGAVIYMGT
jgi:hypothetical protein